MSNDKVKKTVVCNCTAQVKWADIQNYNSIEMPSDEQDECPVCGMYRWYEESPMPIHEYQGEYPILSTTEGGNVCLWLDRFNMVVVKRGNPSGWLLGEEYTCTERGLESWGRGSCVVLTDPVTIQF
jgi:hypothetical protein